MNISLSLILCSLCIPSGAADGPVSAAEAVAIEAGMELDGDGVQLLEVGSGLAVISRNTAYYPIDQKNPALLLRGQRFAAVQAQTNAEVGLMTFFEGMETSRALEIRDRLKTEDTNESSAASVEFRAAESGHSVACGILRGAVTYKIDDRPDEGSISIWVVSSPGTRRVVRRSSSRGVTVADYAKGLDLVKAAVLSGVTPPDGARMLTVPSTGEVAWVGYGSAILNPIQMKRGGRMKATLLSRAKSDAVQFARASLVSCMRGVPIKSNSQNKSDYSDSQESVTNLLDGSVENEASTVSTTESKSLLQKILKNGTVPADVTTHTVLSKDGNWMIGFAIYREVKPTLKKRAPAPPRQSRNDAPSSLGSGPVTQDRALASSATVPVAPEVCDEGITAGTHRVQVTMQGVDRRSALSGAVLEAIQRANGFALEGSSVMKEAYSDAVSDVNGKLDTVTLASAESSQEIRTMTNGMVCSFKVLQEVAEEGGIELTVCVDVPRFDPTNPRPGKRPTLVLLPFHVDATEFANAGEAVSAQSLAEELEATLAEELVRSKMFTVIDRRLSKQVNAELLNAKSGVKDGSMRPEEAAKIGNLLSADFILSGRLVDLSYEQFDKYIAATKRNERHSRLSVRSLCKVTSVGTGEIISSDVYERQWSTLDIMKLRKEFPALEPLSIAFIHAADSHASMVLTVPEEMKKANQLAIVQVIEGGQILLLRAHRQGFASTLSVGQEMVVSYGFTTDDGDVFQIDRGRIVVTSIDGVRVQAKPATGQEKAAFVKGDVARVQ